MDDYARTQREMESARKIGSARKYVNLGDKLGIPEEARDPHLQAEVDFERTKYVPITEDVKKTSLVSSFADLKLPEPSEYV